MISVDAHHLLAFSDLTCHLEDTGIGVFWLPDSKEIQLGSSDQEASPSAGKNTGVVLVPCLRTEFSVRVRKITPRIGV